MNKLEIIYDILPDTGPVAFEIPEIPDNKKVEIEKEISKISDSRGFKTENIGAGADWIVVVAYMTGLFFLGDKINKNLEAWLSLSKKFISLFKKTKVRFIDANGARLIAINRILKNEESISSIIELAFNEINLQDLTTSFSDGRKPNELKSKPLCYFSAIYKVNQSSYYILGIKSDGTVRTIDKINETQFGFNQIHVLKK